MHLADCVRMEQVDGRVSDAASTEVGGLNCGVDKIFYTFEKPSDIKTYQIRINITWHKNPTRAIFIIFQTLLNYQSYIAQYCSILK